MPRAPTVRAGSGLPFDAELTVGSDVGNAAHVARSACRAGRRIVPVRGGPIRAGARRERGLIEQSPRSPTGDHPGDIAVAPLTPVSTERPPGPLTSGPT